MDEFSSISESDQQTAGVIDSSLHNGIPLSSARSAIDGRMDNRRHQTDIETETVPANESLRFCFKL